MRTVLAMVAGVLLLLIVTAVPTTAGDESKSPQPYDPRHQKGDGNNTSSPAYAPHQLVVRLRTDTIQFSAENRIVQGYSAQLGDNPVYLVTLDPGSDVLAAAATFSQSPQVEYAHPNYVLNHSHPIQGSYPFSDQNFKGDYAGQYASTQLGLAQAHQLAEGAGVIVGVIDGGIDITHSALGGTAVSGYDFVDNDYDASDEPGGQASGHGTFVAGVIHLVAPSATIRSYRVMNASGDGDGFTVARAIEQAAADGCSIVNISLALTGRSLAVRDAVDMASAQGVLVIGGAGNLGSSVPVYPAAENNVLAVAALDSLYGRASFSSYGSYVDLCAPGDNVYSAYQKPYFAWWSGTSFSAPFVSGLAALAKQKFPDADGLQLRNRLMSTAMDVGVQNPNYIGALGAGIVNPAVALTATVTNDTAVFIPDTLYYTYQQYSQMLVVPQVTGVLISTNAPSAYIPHIVDTGTLAFAWVDDTSGTTNDSVEIFLRTTNTLGTYYNTLAFQVIGVMNPALVTIELTVVPRDTVFSSAWLNPPEMWFTGNINTYSILNGASFLSSTNAPATFHAEIPSGTGGYLVLIDSVGQTNDSVRFGVIPARVPGPGLYADTIVYHVDGIEQPAALIVNLNAMTGIPLCNLPGDVNQNGLPWEMADLVLLQVALITGDPSLLIPGIGNSDLNGDCIIDTVDRVKLERIIQGYDSAPGTPCGNCSNYTLVSIDTSHGGNSLCNLPGDVNQNGIPWEMADLVALKAALNTGDSVYLGPMIGNSDLDANCRIDTVDRVELEMIILGIDSAPGHLCGNCQSYEFTPNVIELCNLPGDVDCDGLRWEVADMVALAKALDSGDIGLLGPIIGNSDVDGNCRIDSVDLVNYQRYFQYGLDSANFILSCAACQSYVFSGDTIGNQGGDSAWSIPSSVSFFAPNGSTNIVYRDVILASTLATDYSASHSGSLNWLVYSQTGVTNDSVLIGANPTGLQPGLYVDTLTFLLTGIRKPVYLPVVLTVTGADSVAANPSREVSLANYPNPFNPNTECVYSIPATGHVLLKVYDVLGREVITLVDETKEAGTHRVMWRGQTSSGNQASSGVYLYRIEANGVSVTRKMLLLK